MVARQIGSSTSGAATGAGSLSEAREGRAQAALCGKPRQGRWFEFPIRNRYHGAVVWSWQQALFAAGLDRQLRRTDLSPSARTAIARARSRLGDAIQAADAVRGSELWSWSQHDGRYRVEPFGQRREEETESNAAQLWSTVYLAQP